MVQVVQELLQEILESGDAPGSPGPAQDVLDLSWRPLDRHEGTLVRTCSRGVELLSKDLNKDLF